jgi:hypothetical protein
VRLLYSTLTATPSSAVISTHGLLGPPGHGHRAGLAWNQDATWCGTVRMLTLRYVRHASHRSTHACHHMTCSQPRWCHPGRCPVTVVHAVVQERYRIAFLKSGRTPAQLGDLVLHQHPLETDFLWAVAPPHHCTGESCLLLVNQTQLKVSPPVRQVRVRGHAPPVLLYTLSQFRDACTTYQT